MDYLGTYEQLVTDWVTSLPHGSHGIPNQTRVLKEKMIRGIALDLCLARIVRISNTADHNKASQVSESANQGRAAVKPVTSSRGTAVSLLSSQLQLPSSQTVGTEKDSSQALSSEKTPDEQAKEAPMYSNLATFTTFREPRRLPRNVALLLSHWKPATDPSTYEWTKTSQMLENEESQRISGPGTPRHARRRRSRSRPVAPEATATATATSLPPTPIAPMIRAWGSQPTNAPSISLTSSQPTVDDVSMTQVERGQFGAREVKKSSKAKKKRRAAGF